MIAHSQIYSQFYFFFKFEKELKTNFCKDNDVSSGMIHDILVQAKGTRTRTTTNKIYFSPHFVNFFPIINMHTLNLSLCGYYHCSKYSQVVNNKLLSELLQSEIYKKIQN